MASKRVKTNSGLALSNQLLEQVIKEGIRVGKNEYRQNYQGGLNQMFHKGLISIKRRPGCLEDDLEALNKLDYHYNRHKVTTLLSFNPNWQLLARRLSKYRSVVENKN